MDTVTITIDGVPRPAPVHTEGFKLYRMAEGPPVLVQTNLSKVRLIPASHSPLTLSNGDTFESRDTFDASAQNVEDLIADATAPLEAKIAQLEAQVAALTPAKK